MKKLLFTLFIGLVFHGHVIACDACGCQLGGYYMGIMPQYQTHFIGFRYSRAMFHASIDNTFSEDEFSEDLFTRWELMARAAVSDRFQVSLVMPYVNNEMNGNLQQAKATGVGDPVLLVYYNPINTGDKVLNTWKHALLLGAGVKLPMGEFRQEDGSGIINRNFQVGTGSVDYLASLSYTLRRLKAGLNMETNYKLNGRNPVDYRFGNQWNAGASFFYWFDTPVVTILPFAGAFFEQAASHDEGLIRQDNTGGHALFSSLGMQVFYKNLTVQFTWQDPLAQSYRSDPITTIEADNRLMAGLIMHFSRRKEQIGE